jgi:hypothetical protein
MARSYKKARRMDAPSIMDAAHMCAIDACRAVARGARDAGDARAMYDVLGVSKDTLRRLIESADYGGWTLDRVLALAAYESDHGGATIRAALTEPAGTAVVGDAMAAHGGLILLIGRFGRVQQIAAETLAAGRVQAGDAARARDEIAQLNAFCRDRLLPDLTACIGKG